MLKGEKAPAKYRIRCRECGHERSAAQRGKFCSSMCRQKNINRGNLRGGQLYDLFMAMRYDRANAQEQELWKLMCRMGQKWHEEDKAAGRPSFTPYQELAADGRFVQYAYEYRGRV